MPKGLQKKVGPLPLWAWIVIIGGTVGLYLRHRSSTSSTATGSTVDPATGLTYAQEQADTQAGIDPLTGQPYSLETTSGNTQGAGGGGIGSGGLSDPGAGTPVQTLTGQLADVASGVTALQQLESLFQAQGQGTVAAAPPSTTTTGGGAPPKQAGTITTHKGGAFYKYYVKATGHPPPKIVSTTNPLYELWQQGVKLATTGGGPKPHTGSGKAGGHSPATPVRRTTQHQHATPPRRPSSHTPPKPKHVTRGGVRRKGP